jgi:hypothetical protein
MLLGCTDPGDTVLLLDVAYPSYWGALKVGELAANALVTTYTTLEGIMLCSSSCVTAWVSHLARR